jgi:medium-chain acyl-[acyl-carrier-protein] hydrolase
MRLYCFSYAGGSAAAFLPWQAQLDPSIELCAVELPGRGMRMMELPYAALPALVADLAQVISRERDLSFAFFGHSLGGLIAFELARYCQCRHLPMPEHMFASGSAAPQDRSPAKHRPHELSDHALIDVLNDYNGTPPEVLAHQELMALMLPTIRADFALDADYQYRPYPRLSIPITVLAGKRDDFVSKQVEEWKNKTTGPCTIEWYEGDHFFIHAQRDAVIACVNAALLRPQATSAGTRSALQASLS